MNELKSPHYILPKIQRASVFVGRCFNCAITVLNVACQGVGNALLPVYAPMPVMVRVGVADSGRRWLNGRGQ